MVYKVNMLQCVINTYGSKIVFFLIKIKGLSAILIVMFMMRHED